MYIFNILIFGVIFSELWIRVDYHLLIHIDAKMGGKKEILAYSFTTLRVLNRFYCRYT